MLIQYLTAHQSRTRLGDMLYQTCLGDGTVGQHEVIVRTDGETTDGMRVVSCLYLVHHDEWFTLRYQPLDVISGSKFFHLSLIIDHYFGKFCSI